MNKDIKQNADLDEQLPDLAEVPELQLEEVSGGSLLKNKTTVGIVIKPIGWWYPDPLVR